MCTTVNGTEDQAGLVPRIHADGYLVAVVAVYHHTIYTWLQIKPGEDLLGEVVDCDSAATGHAGKIRSKGKIIGHGRSSTVEVDDVSNLNIPLGIGGTQVRVVGTVQARELVFGPSDGVVLRFIR